MILEGASFLFLAVLVSFVDEVQSTGISVCYYRNWAQYKKNPVAKFYPEDVVTRLCSVVNYASFEIDVVTHELKGRQRNDAEMLGRLNDLKKNRTGLKVFISVGGWNHENIPRYSNMSQTAAGRKVFINSMLAILKQHKIDGISLDWEYPMIRPKTFEGIKNDKENLVKLLREMRLAFEVDKILNGKQERYFLTMAVPASRKKVKGFDIDALANYTDWVNVMAYNMRGQWNTVTGCPTPMKGKLPNVPDSIMGWIDAGLPPSKINLGLALYARGFMLSSESLAAGDFSVGAKSVKRGYTQAGPLLGKKGVLSYYEICFSQTIGEWSHRVSFNDSECGIPYATTAAGGWAAYEDPASIRYKIRTLVNRLGLNGFSIWSLDFDDFRGNYCNPGKKYPLLTAAVNEMMGGAVEQLSSSDQVQQYHDVAGEFSDLSKPVYYD